ncbi:hypothetical protein FKG94_16590 [Exilibacterium tricleocarpae]|uniref:Chaperone NapD n=1 Tax=Exilibacterium tricleocarpae TaxID=2591008 RepID=A0A545TAH3_9GAMM|nr:chaperone NapD [Exilibacterium tricleocarpae]TQV74223.1 hypothetical protein FKG94_16590 [Exilibacterium tricleocarpae]
MTHSPPRDHVTSLVVHASAAALQDVLARVRRLPATEVHTGEPPGKFIVVLETETEQQILQTIDRIRDIDGVLSAAMVYHHVDP